MPCGVSPQRGEGRPGRGLRPPELLWVWVGGRQHGLAGLGSAFVFLAPVPPAEILPPTACGASQGAPVRPRKEGVFRTLRLGCGCQAGSVSVSLPGWVPRATGAGAGRGVAWCALPWQGCLGPELQVTGRTGWGRRWKPPGSGDPAGGPGFVVSHPYCPLVCWGALATCCVGSKAQTLET